MTSLRQRMLEDMQIRKLSPLTQRAYVEHVARFARHFGQSPTGLGSEEIRSYQVYLTHEKKLSASSMVVAVASLRFLYEVTLQKTWSVEAVIPAPRTPRTLPVVLSPAEVVQFLHCVKSPEHRIILTTCYAAGLRISDAVHLTLPAVDSQRMVLCVEQGKGQKDRYVMLSPKLLEILREWWRVSRPRHWFFPGARPGHPITSRAVDRACRQAHRRCGIPKPITPHSLRHRRPSPGNGHRRAHNPITARPPESRDDGPVSLRRDDHGLLDGEPPGGGLSPDGTRWISCRPGFFLPVRVLSRLFRRLFLTALPHAFDGGQSAVRRLAPGAVGSARLCRSSAACANDRPSGWSTRNRPAPARHRGSTTSAVTPTGSPSPTSGQMRVVERLVGVPDRPRISIHREAPPPTRGPHTRAESEHGPYVDSGGLYYGLSSSPAS